MLTTVEGVYKEGRVELTEIPRGVQEARVLVTFLYSSHEDANVNGDKTLRPGQMVYRGMFKTDRDLTEEDFKSAEFHGDADDGLDWS